MGEHPDWATRGRMEQTLKKAIRHARTRSGRTQEDCSLEANMSQTRIWSDLERARGRSKPLSISELDEIARATGTTAESLIAEARNLRQQELERLRT